MDRQRAPRRKASAPQPAEGERPGRIRIVQVRSPIGLNGRQGQVLRGLGLWRPGRSVVREDTPSIRGMVKKIPHLVRIESLEGENAG